MTTTCKKLIEVAIPIKEISAESVRDKSIRHGHISTLHLWWARRPLPVCRAIVFASLVPDPLDPACPQAFRDAVDLLLGKQSNPGDPYAPYPDIPWTAVYDPMDDNLRNRLQMFIGKFTNDMQQHLLHNKTKPQAGNMLSDFSLIKWDNKNNEEIITKARKLIWVAHNCTLSLSKGTTVESATDLLASFDSHYQAIRTAEQALYSLPDRHIETKKVTAKQQALDQAIEAFLDHMPRVFDPFAGGGAIPLEAARLGCRSFGNDINPVAHIIQKGSLEFPQKYGKPITYSNEEFIKLYGTEEFNKVPNERKVFENGNAIAINIPNRLSFDVEYYAKKLLSEAEKEIGHLYPADKNGNKPIAYYWARVGTCSNPSCKAEVPLLKGFNFVNTENKKIYLYPVIEGKHINFEIREGVKIEVEGWLTKGNLSCPICGNTTSKEEIRSQSQNKQLKDRLIAIIEDSPNGKVYRLPLKYEIDILESVPNTEPIIEQLVKGDSRNLWITLWGIDTWGDLFTKRQLFSLQTLVLKLNKLNKSLKSTESEYGKAISTYLALFIDRMATRLTAYGIWNTSAETLEHPFGRQAIPMVFDFPESNPFTSSTGGAVNQIEWITKYIEIEDGIFYGNCINASSGDKSQFLDKFITAVVTDPPYYDAIAYADLSDFFYVWLKRTLGDVYPLNFATPQTPKADECTALKHHHDSNKTIANNHFERKLTQIFSAIEHQTSDIVSIMYAHQSTEAWSTLCNSILDSRMNITGSWAIDTERSSAGTKATKAYLSSSVTVSCRPAQRQGYGNYKEVKKAIEQTVEKEVKDLYALGFRGADLLTACFGQAVSEFGKYQKVEKADGSEVTVAELLEMARESAFNALLKGFDGDEFTKFYIGWLQLYGFIESDFDDAAKFSRVGLTINVAELFNEHILIKNGNKQTLGTFEQRIEKNKHLGEAASDNLIDQVHRGMYLFKGTNRNALLQFIGKQASAPESNFWRVLTAICEILPAGTDDHKQASGLLSNKDSLIRESKNVLVPQPQQGTLGI